MQRLEQQLLGTAYQPPLVMPKVKTGVGIATTRTPAEMDSDEQRRQRRKRRTARQNKRGHGIHSTLLEGDEHRKQNSRLRKVPILEKQNLTHRKLKQ